MKAAALLRGLAGPALYAAVIVFLFAPIIVMAWVSLSASPMQPVGGEYTTRWYESTLSQRRYTDALLNSTGIGLAASVLALGLALPASYAIARFNVPGRSLLAIAFILPMVLTNLLIALATSLFLSLVLDLPGGIWTSAISNAVHAFGFAFLILMIELIGHNWNFEAAARTCGAGRLGAFIGITVALIWPALLGALLLGFLVAFNGLEITFYNVGATPTLATVAWGMLRHGIKPELYAFSTMVVVGILAVVGVLAVLVRWRIIERGGRLY